MMRNSLLFGNGLNRLSDNGFSWDDLLKDLKGKNDFDDVNLPNTMTYERIFLERDRQSLDEEFHIKSEIAKEMKNIDGNDFYKQLINLKFDNYLTTNYDYAFKKSLKIEEENTNTEKIYNIRRHLLFEENKQKLKLWNIHGEINHPKSIQLGLDHYCGSIGKIDSYIKGKYKYKVDGVAKGTISIEKKLKNSNFDNVSWIELFFNSNIHVLGMGLDYSEIDLWWILNKRARLMLNNTIKNKIIFYTDKIDEAKKGLLKSFNVDIEIMPNINQGEIEKTNYKEFYKKAIQKISETSK